MSREYTGVEHAHTRVDLLLSDHDTGGRVALISSIERSGCELPLHRHRNEDELVYVLTGELTVFVNGKSLRLASGGCVLLPRRVEHGYLVESQEARVLTVVLPSGLEDYYRELGQNRGVVDLEWLATVAAGYGVEITGSLPGDDGARTASREPPVPIVRTG